MKISVVGGGRMGLPLACMFARRGASVVVCDIDQTVVGAINAGRSPYEEPGLAELLGELADSGRLKATTDTSAAVSQSDSVVIIVPAHLTEERDIELATLLSASEAVGAGLRPDTLVVYETTVSVGCTRDDLVPALEAQSGLEAGVDFQVAYSPERVKANLVFDRLESTPKVVGGLDDASRDKVVALYGEFLGAPVEDVGSMEAAEMTKLAGMLYRDVNIALANELASFCEATGVDFGRVRAAANSDGEAELLLPGIGVGGHCTPVYPHFLIQAARRLGMTLRIPEAARDINDQQPARQLVRVATAWKALRGQQVHIMGFGFRPGVKVETLTTAFPLKDALEQQGARVTIEDPFYSADELRAAGFRVGTAKDAALVVLNTAHDEFACPDFEAWRSWGVEAVLDGRNMWDRSTIETLGIVYFGVGRASTLERRA